MRLQFKGGSSEGCHFPSLERMTWSGVYQDIFASWPKLLPDWSLTLSIPACGNFHNLIAPASRPVLFPPCVTFPRKSEDLPHAMQASGITLGGIILVIQIPGKRRTKTHIHHCPSRGQKNVIHLPCSLKHKYPIILWEGGISSGSDRPLTNYRPWATNRVALIFEVWKYGLLTIKFCIFLQKNNSDKILAQLNNI